MMLPGRGGFRMLKFVFYCFFPAPAANVLPELSMDVSLSSWLSESNLLMESRDI